ncbi:MAG: hypothetical protein GQ552_04120 [Flavobacteriaceae bacterium]|nr:hypothetical protein [Flavobacteriaceae bacterium]
MKKAIIFLAFLLIGFSFSSCDEDDIKQFLPDIDINLLETENIPVHVDKTNGEWATFTSGVSLSIVNNDTKDYLNKIKNIKINKLSYKIINFSGDTSGQVEGSFWADNTISLNNSFVVKTAADNGTVYQITDTVELSRIANALKNGHTINIKYSGEALCDNANLDFVVEVTLDAKVTVDP